MHALSKKVKNVFFFVFYKLACFVFLMNAQIQAVLQAREQKNSE